MASIPKKVQARLVDGIKKYQPIIKSLCDRDVNEADTVTLITDILEDVFGYDKYSEVSREHAIRGTYVDLAVDIEGKLKFLIEVKAIGIDLKDAHIKQAIDYAVNKGVEWTILTNGQNWQVYKVVYAKPIDFELVLNLNFDQLNSRNQSDLEQLYLITREAIGKSSLDEFHSYKQATSKFAIAAVVLSDSVLSIIRRELKRLSKNIQVETDEIEGVIQNEIIKREIINNEKFVDAKKKVKKASNKTLRQVSESKPQDEKKENIDDTESNIIQMKEQ